MKKGFNLLKPQAEPPSVWSKVYDWVLGSARIVIIVVEVIVLIAFGIRIIIDLQGKDLDQKIAQGEAVLNVLKDSELKFRQIQNKTSAYQSIWNNTKDYTALIENINSLLPVNTSIKDLLISIDQDVISISGIADKSREEDVRLLEENLKNNSPYLIDSALERLQDTPDQLKFLFRATLQNIQNKNINTITDNGNI